MIERNQDLTVQCTSELSAKLREVEKRDVASGELRKLFCSSCKNPTCVNAAGGLDPFTHRVQTQEDRFFKTPQVRQSEIGKYQNLPEFKSLENEIAAATHNWKPSHMSSPILVPPSSSPPISRTGNTATPKGGYSLGAVPAQESNDPWAHPAYKTVKAGAKLRLNSKGEIDDS